MLLASRFLGVSATVSRHLSAGALVIYAACCGVNWMWQASALSRLLQQPDHGVSVYIYMALISFVMWDDLALARWLLHNVRVRSGAAGQHPGIAFRFASLPTIAFGAFAPSTPTAGGAVGSAREMASAARSRIASRVRDALPDRWSWKARWLCL
jgi:hypothetical protein